jgi:hypothetical protein
MVYQVAWNQMQLLEFDIACGDSVHFSWAGEMHGLSNTNGLDCRASKVLQDIVPLSMRGDAQVKFDRAGTYYFFCRGERWGGGSGRGRPGVRGGGVVAVVLLPVPAGGQHAPAM